MGFFPHGFLISSALSTAAIGVLNGLTGHYDRGAFWLAIACFAMIVQRFFAEEDSRDGR